MEKVFTLNVVVRQRIYIDGVEELDLQQVIDEVKSNLESCATDFDIELPIVVTGVESIENR